MRDAHAAAVAALRDGDRVGLVTALGAMAVPAEDDVAEFAGVLLSLDESASRERLLRIAAMNTRDSEQWRPRPGRGVVDAFLRLHRGPDGYDLPGRHGVTPDTRAAVHPRPRPPPAGRARASGSRRRGPAGAAP
jgi:hypothetical protein